MEDQYILPKWEWTDADFENMGWHDCPIYALSFGDNVCLDIDYIFKWNHNGERKPYTFWIAPATLIFENPYYLKIDTAVSFINGFEIAGISKEKNDDGSTEWFIDTQQGEIFIGAETYKQIIRRPPSLQLSQSIPFDERGGISFSNVSEKNYRDSIEITKRKEFEFQMRKFSNEKIDVLFEIEKLDKNEIGTKDYLSEKRRLQTRLNEINQLLTDNRM